MTTKQKAIIVCDECEAEIEHDGIKTESVRNEGCSEISLGRNTYDVDDADFCNIECLFAHIRKYLE